MKQALNLEICGSLVLEVLICLQITELKMMITDCRDKIDDIEKSINQLKEKENEK